MRLITMLLMLALFAAPVFAADPPSGSTILPAPGSTIIPATNLGIVASVGTVPVVMWDAASTLNFPATASVMKVASSSASDLSSGTGAVTVTIVGIGSASQKLVEIVTLKGQTPALTVNSYLRINNVFVQSAGTAKANVGDIYVFTGAATAGVPDVSTTIYAKIAAGMGRNLAAVFSTGARQYVRYQRVTFNVGKSEDATFRIWMRPISGGAATLVGYKKLFQDSFQYINDLPLIIYPNTDMWVDCASSATATNPSAEMTGVYYDSTEMPFMYPKP